MKQALADERERAAANSTLLSVLRRMASPLRHDLAGAVLIPSLRLQMLRRQLGTTAPEPELDLAPPGRQRGCMGDLALIGGDESVLVDPVADMAVEVAIRAFRGAERPVHVNAETRVAGRVVDHVHRPLP